MNRRLQLINLATTLVFITTTIVFGKLAVDERRAHEEAMKTYAAAKLWSDCRPPFVGERLIVTPLSAKPPSFRCEYLSNRYSRVVSIIFAGL